LRDVNLQLSINKVSVHSSKKIRFENRVHCKFYLIALGSPRNNPILFQVWLFYSVEHKIRYLEKYISVFLDPIDSY